MIDTPRLLLRPLTPDDAEAVFVWTGDPVVNRYMPYPLYTRVEDVRAWLASLKPDCGEFGFVRKEDGVRIGSGSISEEDGAWELGYNLRRDAWGQGYATEAARALIDWARTEHGATRFTAAHVTKNAASGNVLRKCGFKFLRYGQYGRYDGSEMFDASFYELTIE